MDKGMIHIYTGDGKGKTTAAIGLGCRCAGRGGKVGMTAFLKDYDSGEYMAGLPFEMMIYEKFRGFWNELDTEMKKYTSEAAERQLEGVLEKAYSENFDMIILDEVLFAASVGCVNSQKLIEFLSEKPDTLEIVMTGRNCPSELCEYADYVSEIKCVKHPFEKCINARIGIEC